MMDEGRVPFSIAIWLTLPAGRFLYFLYTKPANFNTALTCVFIRCNCAEGQGRRTGILYATCWGDSPGFSSLRGFHRPRNHKGGAQDRYRPRARPERQSCAPRRKSRPLAIAARSPASFWRVYRARSLTTNPRRGGRRHGASLSLPRSRPHYTQRAQARVACRDRQQ